MTQEEKIQMDLETRVGKTLFKVIDEVNQLLPEEAQLKKTMGEALTGPKTKIDSLGLINFILTSERAVEQEFGKLVTLTDSSVLMKGDNITLTVGSIKDFLCERLADGKK